MWPPFSSMPLLFLVMVKPLTDAFYEVEEVKYVYILLLVGSALFAKFGLVIQGVKANPRNKGLFSYLWLIMFYFLFHYGLALFNGGSFSEMFKIVSPFVFFVLVAYAGDRWMIYALAGAAVLTVVVNAALMPFDFAWVNWGTVRTFKGYYYFKTDLAYALSFSVLIFAFFEKNRITPALALLMLIAAVEVVLANSRLNYLSFLCVVIFIAAKEGISFRSVVRYSLIFGLLGVIAALLYDPEKLLGFDFDDIAAFTQGRNVTWEHLMIELEHYRLVDWLFGKGVYADLILSSQLARLGAVAHNAHNEILHMVYTEGILGFLFYIVLWVKTFRMSIGTGLPPWARGSGAVALTLFLLQGLTAVVSSFATKTWPLVMVLIALRGVSTCQEPDDPSAPSHA